jgi:hypothetical protein
MVQPCSPDYQEKNKYIVMLGGDGDMQFTHSQLMYNFYCMRGGGGGGGGARALYNSFNPSSSMERL